MKTDTTHWKVLYKDVQDVGVTYKILQLVYGAVLTWMIKEDLYFRIMDILFI